ASGISCARIQSYCDFAVARSGVRHISLYWALREPAPPWLTPPVTTFRSFVEIVMVTLLVREVDVIVVAGDGRAHVAAQRVILLVDELRGVRALRPLEELLPHGRRAVDVDRTPDPVERIRIMRAFDRVRDVASHVHGLLPGRKHLRVHPAGDRRELIGFEGLHDLRTMQQPY